MVADWSDDEIWRLTRGGHDPFKVYAAYHAAQNHKGQPTVILAKTVKGYGMGEAGEGQNITHQQKKMGETHLHGVPRPLRPAADRRADRRGPVPHVRGGQPGARATCTSAARRWAATCRPRREVGGARGAAALGLRGPA